MFWQTRFLRTTKHLGEKFKCARPSKATLGIDTSTRNTRSTDARQENALYKHPWHYAKRSIALCKCTVVVDISSLHRWDCYHRTTQKYSTTSDRDKQPIRATASLSFSSWSSYTVSKSVTTTMLQTLLSSTSAPPPPHHGHTCCTWWHSCMDGRCVCANVLWFIIVIVIIIIFIIILIVHGGEAASDPWYICLWPDDVPRKSHVAPTQPSFATDHDGKRDFSVPTTSSATTTTTTTTIPRTSVPRTGGIYLSIVLSFDRWIDLLFDLSLYLSFYLSI